MPLSASVLVSREELAELLQAALDRMPDELRQARWLLKERDEFLAEKDREADALLEEVRVQAERMVQRTEIVRQANHVAQRILDDANEEARRMRHEAEDYADQKLASFEIVLDRTMKTVQAGREKLQVTPLPKIEIGEGGQTSVAPSAGPNGPVRAPTSPRASSTRTSPEPADPVRTDPSPSGPPGSIDPSAAGETRRSRRPQPFVVQVAALRKVAGATRHETRCGSRSRAGRRRCLGARRCADLRRCRPGSYPGGITVDGHGAGPLAGGVPPLRRPGVGGRWSPRSGSATSPAGGTEADEDAYPLVGDELDLEPLARDAVLLDLPLAPLCSADCLGLCPSAGPTGTTVPATVRPRSIPAGRPSTPWREPGLVQGA